MKRIFLHLIAVSILVLAASIVGCKKDIETSNVTIPSNSTENRDAVKQIIAFNKQVQQHRENPASRSTELITLDEALAGIGGLFNAVYCLPDEYYSRSSSHTFSINLPIASDGKVMLNNVLDVYEQAVDSARVHYMADGVSENKGYLYIIVSAGVPADGNVTLSFRGVSGKIEVAPEVQGQGGPFGEDDNWYYKAPMGKCDSLCDSGADLEIENKIKSLCYSQRGIDPVTGQRFVYYDHRTDYFLGNQFENLFHRTDVNDICIDSTYMNLFYYGELDALHHLFPEYLGLPITGANSFYLVDFSIVGMEIPNTCITHETQATYARRSYVWQQEIEYKDLQDED